MKMTPNQTNAAIATDLGWTEIEICGCSAGYLMGRDPGDKFGKHLPPFHSSLDTIQTTARQKFTGKDKKIVFEGCLQGIASRRGVFVWQLSASDWCEAYLRAVGKWEEAA